MADGGTLKLRITDLICSDYTTIDTYSGDLINAAINEVADMISNEMLLKHSKTPGILQSNSEWLVEDRKILNVTRIDSDTSGIERKCKEVNRGEFALAADSGSIYKATAYSPIYHQDTSNDGAATLKILPEPGSTQKGKIWYFSYIADSYDAEDITGALLNSSLYLPSNCIHAVALKSCINILQAFISEQVQEEEDQEMLGMVTTQLQGLEKSFAQEMQRFMDKVEQPEGE